MTVYVVTYFASAFLALFLTPVVARICNRVGLMDNPGARKVHKKPVPRAGGVVFVVPVLFVAVPLFFADSAIAYSFRQVKIPMITLLVAAVFIYVIGLLDDIRSVSAKVKLLSLVGAGVAVCLAGARIESIAVGSWFTLKLGWATWPVTVAWIVGVTVGVNFLDGLDGLAAGISVIVCGTIAVLALATGQVAMFALMLVLAGGLTGFLFFNFNPAKIFMGDGGSMFLGFVIGAGSVVCQAKSATLVGIALPILALGVPLVDTLLAMIRRAVLDRRSVFSGERGHIHHRLLDRGLPQRTVVIIIYVVTFLAAGIGSLMLVIREGAQMAVLVGGLLFLFVVFHIAGSLRLKETLVALRHNAAFARERKEEKAVFENAQVEIRRAESFDAWWDIACSMAKEMDFARLALSWRDEQNRFRELHWRRSHQSPRRDEVIDVAIPVNNGKFDAPVELRASVALNGSFESAVRHVAMFGRLLDEPIAPLHLDLSRQGDGARGPRVTDDGKVTHAAGRSPSYV